MSWVYSALITLFIYACIVGWQYLCDLSPKVARIFNYIIVLVFCTILIHLALWG